MKYQVLLFLKKYLRMSSAAAVIGALRVKSRSKIFPQKLLGRCHLYDKLCVGPVILSKHIKGSTVWIDTD